MGISSTRSKAGPALLVFVGIGLALCVVGVGAKDSSDRVLLLDLRTRTKPYKASDTWREVSFQEELRVSETAIVICDMWDNHWCTGAARRVEILARKMAPVLDVARSHGILMIHAPSDTMEFYKDAAQRKRIANLARVDPPLNLALADPSLPIDDSDEGCDTPPDKFYKAWTRENAAIPIAEADVISDNGEEIYSLLRQRGIKSLLVMGVHTNMCVLNRSFAIKQMTRWGVRCILVRDLTDTMYNPKMPPYVPHDQGTDLVVEYIEKYWCPTVSSSELVQALEQAE